MVSTTRQVFSVTTSMGKGGSLTDGQDFPNSEFQTPKNAEGNLGQEQLLVFPVDFVDESERCRK